MTFRYLGILLSVCISTASFAQQNSTSKTPTPSPDETWVSRLVAGKEQRCMYEEVRLEPTRTGFSRWFYGGNWQPDHAGAKARLTQRDLQQIRTTELAIDEMLLDQMSQIALASVKLPKNFNAGFAKLSCHPPKLKLGNVENQKIFISFSCDTTYDRPWKSECKVTKDNPCTLIEVGLRLFMNEKDANSARLSADISLDRLRISLPSLEQLISAKSTALAQDIESFSTEVKSNLATTTDLQKTSAEAIAAAKKKFGPAHKFVKDLSLNLKQISEYLSMLTGLGEDQTELGNFARTLLGINENDAGSFDGVFNKVSPAVQKVLTEIGKLEDQMVEAYNQMTLIVSQLEGSAATLETSLADLRDQLATLDETMKKLDATVTDLKKVLADAPAIGAAQDKNLVALWDGLSAGLRRELEKLPHNFPLVTLKPLEKSIGIPALKGKVRLMAQFGSPRIEHSATTNRHSLILSIKMKPIDVIPTPAVRDINEEEEGGVQP